MERRRFTVTSVNNKLITLGVIPGHFATGNAHFSHYLDMSQLKTDALLARDAAREMAAPYLSGQRVDTVICMEETEVIGAYLAEELLENGTMVVNTEWAIHVVKPLSNVNGQLVFRQSAEPMVRGKRVVLMVASVASGRTVNRALDCLQYYRGQLAGISAIFTAAPEIAGYPIGSIFSSADIPGYQVARPAECPMCREGRRLDAIVSYDGYTRL